MHDSDGCLVRTTDYGSRSVLLLFVGSIWYIVVDMVALHVFSNREHILWIFGCWCRRLDLQVVLETLQLTCLANVSKFGAVLRPHLMSCPVCYARQMGSSVRGVPFKLTLSLPVLLCASQWLWQPMCHTYYQCHYFEGASMVISSTFKRRYFALCVRSESHHNAVWATPPPFAPRWSGLHCTISLTYAVMFLGRRTHTNLVELS